MPTKKDQEELFQLKIDYLQFMAQILDWHEPNIVLIIHTLLMEGKRVTQSELIDLTGLSRSTISETLSLMMNDPRGIPVLQTRKKGDKRKYYYCPLHFNEYVKKLFWSYIQVIKLNLSFIPSLINELKNNEQKEGSIHLKNFLLYFYLYNHYIQAIMDHYDESIDNYFSKPEEKINLSEYVDKELLNINIDEILAKHPPKTRKFSLERIKKDIIDEFIKIGRTSSSGANKDLAYIFFLLYMEKSPITQDLVKDYTESRIASISEAFNMLEQQQFVIVIKKPGDRKKYYQPKAELDSFISQRMELSKHKINQINLMMHQNFMKRLDTFSSFGEEKRILKNFFNDTAMYYKRISDWMQDMITLIKSEINKRLKLN